MKPLAESTRNASLEAQAASPVYSINVLKKTTRNAWGRLLIGVLLILLFVFVIAPALQRLPFVAPMHTFIQERGIDATALFYTDSEEFGNAEIRLNPGYEKPRQSKPAENGGMAR